MIFGLLRCCKNFLYNTWLFLHLIYTFLCVLKHCRTSDKRNSQQIPSLFQEKQCQVNSVICLSANVNLLLTDLRSIRLSLQKYLLKINGEKQHEWSFVASGMHWLCLHIKPRVWWEYMPVHDAMHVYVSYSSDVRQKLTAFFQKYLCFYAHIADRSFFLYKTPWFIQLISSWCHRIFRLQKILSLDLYETVLEHEESVRSLHADHLY